MVELEWFHNILALGIPGAGNWREERDAGHLDGIPTIYLVLEPDQRPYSEAEEREGGRKLTSGWQERSTL